MVQFLIAFFIFIAVPTLSHAKTPKCPKGDKACAKKLAKKSAKKEKADKKVAKKGKKVDKKHAKKTASQKLPKKKKPIKMDMPADVSEPMPLPDNMVSEQSPAAANSETTASALTPARSTSSEASKSDLEDDIFPESSATPPGADDFVDEELPAE